MEKSYFAVLLGNETTRASLVLWSSNPRASAQYYNRDDPGWRLDVTLGPFGSQEEARSCAAQWTHGTRARFRSIEPPLVTAHFEHGIVARRRAP